MNGRTGCLLVGLVTTPGAAAAGYPAHQGESPWSFDTFGTPSDTYVVNDTDSPTIDSYLRREGGPIVIDLPIRRYVGPTDAEGYLLDAATLVERGAVSPQVTVRMPAFDVDTDGYQHRDCDGDFIIDPVRGEVNEVYLNGELLGILEGENGVWTAHTFRVPVDQFRFPPAPGETAVNRFRIDIDVANRDTRMSGGGVGCEVWATAIDWISASFEARSPVVLIHGIRSSGEAFAELQKGLDAAGVISDASIDLAPPPAPDELPVGCEAAVPYNRHIAFNVLQLRERLPEIAERYGTDSLHLVGHSKGGLDARGLLSSLMDVPVPVTVGHMGGEPVTRDLTAGSLITLNTPHRGSVLAKYGVEARQLTRLQAYRSGLNVIAAKTLEGAYYCDLRPEAASAFTATSSLPVDVQTASLATNSDKNGDLIIGADEAEGFEFFGVQVPTFMIDRLYQINGTVADVSITVEERAFLPDRISVDETPTAQFRPNDVIVTQDSAAAYPTYDIDGWHHLNVHSEENGAAVAADALEPGLIDWRLR